MTSEQLAVPYGSGEILFRLERRARKTLSINVHPDQEVEVVAPIDAPVERIFEKVRKRAPWIRKQLAYFEQFTPRTTERRYVSGETHLYLGRQYKLKVVPHVQQRVTLFRGQLIVQTHTPKNEETVRGLVQDWFKERACLKFPERVEVCRELFPDPEQVRPTGLLIRQLKQRWGSMTPAGKLVLNRALVSASVDAIDYVVTHELSHMIHPHHGPDFFDLLEQVMPDWSKRKMKLERQLA